MPLLIECRTEIGRSIGVRKVPASVSAGFMGVMPPSAMALSFLLLGERSGPAEA